jgi:hypothetical protein
LKTSSNSTGCRRKNKKQEIPVEASNEVLAPSVSPMPSQQPTYQRQLNTIPQEN